MCFRRALKANERKEQAKIEKEAKLKTEKEKELEEKWSRGAKDQSKRVELEKKKVWSSLLYLPKPERARDRCHLDPIIYISTRFSININICL